jgi:hypothetical protein
MRCAVGRCLGSLAVPGKALERTVDPLLHILLHEPCEIRTIPLPRGRRASLVTLVEKYKGNWLWHYSGPRFSINQEIVSWVESTTHVRDWLKSERSFRAPSDWPEIVESHFGVNVPTPWELANVFPHTLPSRTPADTWYGHDMSTLIAYACGLTVYEISKIVDISEQSVLHHMVSGVEKIKKIPQYVLWSMNLDWSNLMPITMRDVSVKRRVKFFKQLSDNPMGVLSRDISKAFESPTFRFSVESSLCPKRDGRRPVHKYVIIGEPR